MFNLPEGSSVHIRRYESFIQALLQKRVGQPCYNPVKGFERHHILPKALGGEEGFGNKANIVLLTPREHYIAHLMLWKAYGKKMARAFWCMSHVRGSKGRLSGRRYESLKQALPRRGAWNKGIPMREESKQKMVAAKRANPRPAHNRGVPTSDQTKLRLREAHLGRRPSDETRAKMSMTRKGRPSTMSDDARERLTLLHSRPILCVETGEVFRSSIAANAWVKVMTGKVVNTSYVANGKYTHAAGFHWAWHKKDGYQYD